MSAILALISVDQEAAREVQVTLGRTFARIRNRIPTAIRDPLELLLAKNSVLLTTGWHRSRKEMASINADGEPIPWINYPALRFLEPRIRKSFKVFEFGSGLSTMWWAKRVLSVVSVEHDPDWYDRIAENSPRNVAMLLRDGDEYVQSAAGGIYDIIVIDGIMRTDCGRAALSSLAPNGVIVWDNTDEIGDRAGHAFMRESGFRRLDFWGLGPLMVKEWCTTVFYRSGNCLDI